MRGDNGVAELGASFARVDGDLTAGAANVCVEIEGFPEVVETVGGGFGADVEQDADVGVENGGERVECPAMRVDFLLVLKCAHSEGIRR